MIPHRFHTALKTLISSTFLATALMTPAAYGETVSYLVTNIRGADGIYRPALRIIRGASVTFVDAGNNQSGLTEDILRDAALLGQWLAANVTTNDPANPLVFEETIIDTSTPSPASVSLCMTHSVPPT